METPNSRRERFLGDTLVRREDKRDWQGHVADSFSYFRRDQKSFWAKKKIIQFYHAWFRIRPTRGIWILFFSFRTRLRETWEEGLLMEVQFPTTTVRISTTIQFDSIHILRSWNHASVIYTSAHVRNTCYFCASHKVKLAASCMWLFFLRFRLESESIGWKERQKERYEERWKISFPCPNFFENWIDITCERTFCHRWPNHEETFQIWQVSHLLIPKYSLSSTSQK